MKDLNFEKGGGLLPAIIQDADTGKVLMLGFMNQAAWQKTCAEKRVTFYSRTKKRLWTKGETSGHFLSVESVRTDCDDDTILIKARPAGPVCHTGADTCFGESNAAGFDLFALQKIIKNRKENPTDQSYTASLFARGINKIAQKVGEEAVELVIEAKDDNRDLFLNEAADLVYHLLVLLEAKSVDLGEVIAVLADRHRP